MDNLISEVTFALDIFSWAVTINFFEDLGEVVGRFKAKGIGYFVDLHVTGQKHFFGLVYFLGVDVLCKTGISTLFEKN